MKGKVKNFKFLRLAFWVVIGALLVLKFFLTTNLGGNLEFLRTYKFVTSDSYDWIANGVGLFESEDITFRNPGLVLIIKALFSLRVLYLLPLLNQLIFFGILVFIYKIAAKLTENKFVPYIAVVFMFLNYSILSFSDYLLADYYAIFFITVSVYYFLRHKYQWSLFFLGFSIFF